MGNSKSIVLSLMFLCVSLFAAKSFAQEDFLLYEHNCGMLTIGMAADDLYRYYNRDNIKLVDLNYEGHFTPAFEIHIDGNSSHDASLHALIDKKDWWIIDRIIVFDERFVTVKGIRVGSNMGEVRKNYAITTAGTGEGNISIYIDEIKMSFCLEIDLIDLPRGWQNTNEENSIPDSTKIKWIGLR